MRPTYVHMLAEAEKAKTETIHQDATGSKHNAPRQTLKLKPTNPWQLCFAQQTALFSALMG